jgi:hypothetical protein
MTKTSLEFRILVIGICLIFVFCDLGFALFGSTTDIASLLIKLLLKQLI